MDEQNSSGKKNGFTMKTAGTVVVIVFLLTTSIGWLGSCFTLEGKVGLAEYRKEMTVFIANEAKTGSFNERLRTGEVTDAVSKELDTEIIPMWRENIEISKRIDGFENLDPKLRERNKRVREYSETRLKVFELFKRAIAEDTEKYVPEIEKLNAKIESLLKKIEEIEV